mmetsp:Transcript_108703/g.171488  ORF Transcript_108703/g.171488 Transcript_108703/m.171488 type:complete len:222 (+) Transcript_108703:103-768(+)
MSSSADDVYVPSKSTLYCVPRTIASPIVQIASELDLVPGEIEVVRLDFQTLKEKVVNINPMGTSPTFVTKDGVHMWESGAVLAWILAEYDKENKLHPSPENRKKFAAFLQFQQYVIATVYPFVAKWFLHTLKDVSEQDPAFIASSGSTWSKTIAPTLETQLGTKQYMLGDEISAVDYLIAKPLRNADALGALAEFASLKALLDKISSRPSYEPAYGFEGTL